MERMSNHRLGLAALGILGVILLASTAQGWSRQAQAESIVARCAEHPFPPRCYEEAVPELMDGGTSMEDALAVAVEIQKINPDYRDCHTLGHKLSAKETARNPKKWKEVITRSIGRGCNSGAMHGAFQERFRSEKLESGVAEEFEREVRGICDVLPRKATEFDRASCIHGVGHLLLYVTGADIHAALALCEKMMTGSDIQRIQKCYDGAFMQLFQPRDLEDAALIAGKEHSKDTIGPFCDSFSIPHRTPCLVTSIIFFPNDILAQPSFLELYCSSLPEGWPRERCAGAVFVERIADLGFKNEEIKTYCSSLSDSYRNRCLTRAAGRLIEMDTTNIKGAVDICTESSAYDSGESCFVELSKSLSFYFDPTSVRFRIQCTSLPAEWGDSCLTWGRSKSLRVHP